LQIMSPGSWWTSESGFELGDDSSFDNLEKSLAVYKQDVSGSLDRTRTDENRARITDAVLRRFGEMISYSPVGKSAGSVRISITWPDGREAGWRFALRDGSYATVETPEAPQKGEPVMRLPAAIFRDAIIRNMFHHAGISKRCQFLAYDESDMRQLQRAFRTLERHELGLYPLKAQYAGRLLRAYIARWRELFVYASAAIRMKLGRQPIYLVEEAILKGRWQTRTS